MYKNKITGKFTKEDKSNDNNYIKYENWQLKHYSNILWDSDNKSIIGNSPQLYTTSIKYLYLPKELTEDNEEIFVGWENNYDGGKEQNEASKLNNFETISWNELKTRFPKTQFE